MTVALLFSTLILLAVISVILHRIEQRPHPPTPAQPDLSALDAIPIWIQGVMDVLVEIRDKKPVVAQPIPPPVVIEEDVQIPDYSPVLREIKNLLEQIADKPPVEVKEAKVEIPAAVAVDLTGVEDSLNAVRVLLKELLDKPPVEVKEANIQLPDHVDLTPIAHLISNVVGTPSAIDLSGVHERMDAIALALGELLDKPAVEVKTTNVECSTEKVDLTEVESMLREIREAVTREPAPTVEKAQGQVSTIHPGPDRSEGMYGIYRSSGKFITSVPSGHKDIQEAHDDPSLFYVTPTGETVLGITEAV